MDNGDETVVGWLDSVSTKKRSGIAKVRIDDRKKSNEKKECADPPPMFLNVMLLKDVLTLL